MPATNTTTITRLVGKCPVCEGDFKLTVNAVAPGGSHGAVTASYGENPKMVHHGYRRPGDGAGIVGDCFAVGRDPYEVSCGATRDYLAMVELRIEGARARLASLTSGEVRTLHVASWRRGEPSIEVAAPAWWTPGCDTPWETLSQTDDTHAAACAWLDAYKTAVCAVEGRIRAFEREAARAAKLIADWTPAPIRSVDELEAASAAERDAKATAKHVERTTKLQDKVAGYRKRIASALKTRNASTLAEIFESAPTKLLDMGLTIRACTSRLAAFDLLGVDARAAFEAFGLRCTPDGLRASSTGRGGSVDDAHNGAILLTMRCSRWASGKAQFVWPSPAPTLAT